MIIYQFIFCKQEIRDKASNKISLKDDEGPDETERKKLIFRNYQPYDSSLLKISRNVESLVDKNLAVKPNDDVIKAELENITKDDELNIVPKKLNWDLKSQVAPKIEKLNRRTQRAIVEILQKKLAENETDIESDE